MPASDAQVAANRKNALLSTGPRTTEGKERSRRNALKHGLTGEGVALPDEDAAEVAARFNEVNEDFRPTGMAPRAILKRFAFLSVRLDRCERLDTAVYRKRVRHAQADFMDHRLTAVEVLASQVESAPATSVRRLQTMPEGIDWLIASWRELRVDLFNRERNPWSHHHSNRVEALMGRPLLNHRFPRSHALYEGMRGCFSNIDSAEVQGANDEERAEWARQEMGRMIDAEVGRLEQVKAALDPALIEQDRQEAADRCLFDLQPAMTLVRKYEAATERAMYKALKEFRQLEADLQARREGEPTAAEAKELASFEDEDDPDEPLVPLDPRTMPESDPVLEMIPFPAKENLDSASNGFDVASNRLC